MKLFRLAVAAVFALAFGNAYAFHSGGVGDCEGCHSMHNSFEGSANVTGMTQYTSGPYLLKAQDQSGACLNCHEASPGSYHISTPGIAQYDSTTPTQLTPGGDFSWLKKTMTGSVRGGATTWEGDRHGHNIIAADFGYTKDKIQTSAPGGTTGYPAANLACSSCHDPHGKYRRFADGSIATTGLPIFNSGSYTNSAPPITNVAAVGVYRLLGGIGYAPKSIGSTVAFVNSSPAAVAPSNYNGTNLLIAGTAVTSPMAKGVNSDRVVYGSGMSEWCANCHDKMHLDTYTSGTKGQVHPAGNGAKLTAPIAANYAAYVSSGVTSTTPLSGGYSALAPFETGNGQLLTDYTAMTTFAITPTAPTIGNNVLCLSCHRAHASAFESMTRYYLGNEFMTVGDSTGAAFYDSTTTENKINTGYSVAQQTAAYNGRPATLFGPYARDYCNKCHNKD